MQTQIIQFYSGEGTDNKGRILLEFRSWDDSQLEIVHDYIQWMFPLADTSAYNPEAPVLSPEDIEEFGSSKRLQGEMLKSFMRILDFYGFELQIGPALAVNKAVNFAKKSANWLTPYNHNHLRITRILKCLCLTGLRDHAEAFLHELENVYRDHREIVGIETLNYWRDAVQ